MKTLMNFMKKNKGTFYYLTRYGHKPHTDFDYSNSNENIYFVFGKESTGIPPVLLKPHLDKCLRIPMTDNVRALNLSNTVAIVTYEALRQQNYNNLLRDEPHKKQDIHRRKQIKSVKKTFLFVFTFTVVTTSTIV